MIRRIKLNITATGGAGTSSGSATTPYGLHGLLKAIHVDHSTGAATTDFTVAAGDPSRTIMAKADSATDAWFYPGVQRTDASGAAITGAYGDVPLLGDIITCSTAQANNNQTAAVTIVWDDLR